MLVLTQSFSSLPLLLKNVFWKRISCTRFQNAYFTILGYFLFSEFLMVLFASFNLVKKWDFHIASLISVFLDSNIS